MGKMLWAAIFFAANSWAQTYPVKPIRIVVPLLPGGNRDIVARAVAEELSKGPGQSAIIGTQFVKAAPPDGYTLLSVAVTFARVPAVVKAAGYNPTADFTGVSLVCRIPQLLAVNASHPARSVHVTYKGNAQAIVDVMGGQVAMMFDQVSTSAGHVKGGKLRALGVTTKTRSPVLPEVPTLHEQGLTDFEDVTWNGLVAPAGTPRQVLSRLHQEITERGIELVASRSPEEFSAYVKSEADAFGRPVREAGVTVE